MKQFTKLTLPAILTLIVFAAASGQTNQTRFNEVRDRIKASKEAKARAAFARDHKVRHRHPHQESNQAKFNHVRDQIKAKKDAAARKAFARKGDKRRDHKGN